MKVKERKSSASIPLGIVGIILALVFPLAGYACSIPGLVYSRGSRKKSRKPSTAGTILNIIGMSLAAVNSAVAVYFAVKDWLNKD